MSSTRLRSDSPDRQLDAGLIAGPSIIPLTADVCPLICQHLPRHQKPS
jgi:hypothetical protein